MNKLKEYVGLFARYAGFVAMGMEGLALLMFYLLAPSYFTGEYTISYFAALPQTRAIFSFCYLGASLCFWLFANYHLKKHYRTPVKVFAFSMLTMASVALLPYNPGDSINSTAHNLLVSLSFTTFFAGMLLMARLSEEAFFRRATYIAVGVGAVSMLGFALASDESRLLFAFEISTMLSCQLWIIWLSIRAYKKGVV